MKKKVGTVIDEDLLRRANVVAAAEGLPLSRVLEDALNDYLALRIWPRTDSTVASTWEVMPADASFLQAIMEEEGVLDI